MVQKNFKKIGVIATLSSGLIFSGCNGLQPGYPVLSGEPIRDALAISYAYQNTPVRVASYNQPYYYNKSYYYLGGRYYYGGRYINGVYHYKNRRFYNGHFYNKGRRYHRGRSYPAKTGTYGYYHNRKSYESRNWNTSRYNDPKYHREYNRKYLKPRVRY